MKTVIALNVCKKNMIEKVFVFDYTTYVLSLVVFCVWGMDIDEVWGKRVRIKFKRNGYVMPKIVQLGIGDQEIMIYLYMDLIKGWLVV